MRATPRRGPGGRRPDIPVREVAERWLAGESILTLATAYEVGASAITLRLKRAREEFPELPWDQRKPRPTASAARTYAKMNDGKPGVQEAAGSFVRKRRLR